METLLKGVRNESVRQLISTAMQIQMFMNEEYGDNYGVTQI